MLISLLDWEPSLKPRVRLPVWNLNFLILPHSEADVSFDRPSKRQNGERTHPSDASNDINLHNKVRSLILI